MYQADIQHALLKVLTKGSSKSDPPSKYADSLYTKKTDTRSAEDITTGILNKLGKGL